MENGEEETPTVVIFRRYSRARMARYGNGSIGTEAITALFPEIAEGPYDCRCYEHVGQHGACSADIIINSLTRAVIKGVDDEDVEALRREMESEPYNYKLIERQKITPKMRENREKDYRRYRDGEQ